MSDDKVLSAIHYSETIICEEKRVRSSGCQRLVRSFGDLKAILRPLSACQPNLLPLVLRVPRRTVSQSRVVPEQTAAALRIGSFLVRLPDLTCEKHPD